MAYQRVALFDIYISRLSQIAIVKGFATDAGQNLIFGETPQFGPDDPDSAIAIVPQEDQPGRSAENVPYVLPIDIQMLVKADLDMPWMTIELGIGDIKRAMELQDRTLDGLMKPFIQRGTTVALERKEGSTFVGARIQYLNPLVERWGHP